MFVLRRLVLPMVVLVVLSSTLVARIDDEKAHAELRTRLGLPEGFEAMLQPVPDKSAKSNDLLKGLEVAHLGGNRLLFKVTFSRPVNFASHSLSLYVDLDNNPETGRDKGWDKGSDVRSILEEEPHRRKLYIYNKAYKKSDVHVGVGQWKEAVYIAMDCPVTVERGAVALRPCALVYDPRRKHEVIRPTALRLPRRAEKVEALPRQVDNTIRLRASFRAVEGKMAFLPLEDKGLERSDIVVKTPRAKGRPKPAVPFGRRVDAPRGKAGSIERRTVRMMLKDESGVDREHARISFGFPLPEGGLYSTGHMMVSGPAPLGWAEFTPTSHWPDGSLRFVLVTGETSLKAGEEKPLDIAFGTEVQPKDVRRWKPMWQKTNTGYLIDTGRMQLAINTDRFNVFEAAWFDKNKDHKFTDDEKVLVPDPRGIVLVDQQGKAFTMAGKPEKVTLEKAGRYEAILRVEGHYTDDQGKPFMRYITRLRFRRGSTRFTVMHKHINDHLEHELTDITSLSWPIATPGQAGRATVAAFAEDRKTLRPVDGEALRLFQRDDLNCTLTVDGRTRKVEKASGLLSVQGGPSVALHNLWQRYPKALSHTDRGMVIELLPKQPGPTFGQDLPAHLRYPFCEGYYRMKWGMAFTERMTFDVNPQSKHDELVAETELPVVAVVPASWYHQTEALVTVPLPRGEQFKIYDDYIRTSFRLHMIRKEHEREYGFFNYGDWQGERTRNWGNNEYDLGHGLFLAFARTGRRDYYRWALQVARHHVDSDLVHAYPDPYYVGSNMQHSFGHQGNWSQNPTLSTFSHKHDSHTAADNGHTWADDLVDAWCLSGDPVVMEGAIDLGEHICFAVAQPGWEMSLGWPRSAGWQLRAICAINRGRPDPRYLEAARLIAEEPISKQHPSGAWFPEWRKTVSNFQMGLMMGALSTYHQATGDERAKQSLLKAAHFMQRAWDPTVGGWPGRIDPEARGLSSAGPHHNPIILNGMCYAARITNDDELARLCIEGLDAFGFLGIVDSFGKTFAMRMQMMEGLGHLQKYLEAHRDDDGLAAGNGDYRNMLKFVVNASEIDQQFVRRPFTKTFYVKKAAEGAQLVVERKIVGSTLKDPRQRGLTVTDGAGKVVGRDSFDKYSPHTYKLALPGPVGSQFVVTVNDGTHGAWSVGGTGVHAMMTTNPHTTFRRHQQARLYFMVPEGTKTFTLKIIGAHQAPYGAALLDAEGKLVALHKSMNPGEALLKDEDFKRFDDPLHATAFGRLDVKPDPAQTGKPWTLIYWGGGCVNLDLVGVPPYVAIRKEQLFVPKAE